MGIDLSFIGMGWSFPPTFDRGSGSVVMRTGVKDIDESLSIIFSTALGERLMNPTFGCSLDQTLFQAMNASMITYIENMVETAILYYEPRIDAEDVTVTPEQAEGLLTIAVQYTIRGTNSRFNYVYPYYLDPSTG